MPKLQRGRLARPQVPVLLRALTRTLSLATAFVLANPAFAGEYASGFGFGISVPEHYLVLNREEIAKSATEFLDASGDDSIDALPSELLERVFARVQAGEIEVLYRTKEVDASFIDNVNIMTQRARIPRDARQLQDVCDVLPGEFSKLFGRLVALDGCELRVVGDRPALYLEFDGAMPGTKTVQYQIQRRPQETLILTATARASHLPRMLGEFESMVTSIRPRPANVIQPTQLGDLGGVPRN